MRHALSAAVLCVALCVGPAQAATPVFFTHIFLDLKPATFEAIRTSRFLATTFSNAKGHSVPATRTGPGWSGFYIPGKHTYLEILRAGHGPDDALGAVGLGFQIDRRADLAGVGRQLEAATGHRVDTATQTRPVDGKTVDWFDAVGADYGKDDHAMTSSWVMAIYPGYVRRIRPTIEPADGDAVTTAENEFHSYGPDGDGKLFKDVASIALEISAAEKDRLSRELAAYGYRAVKSGVSSTFAAPDLTVVLTASAARRSALYRLVLNKAPAKDETMRLGNSELTLHRDKTAVWRFPLN